jgi:membrane protease YdiL (CAAX protease family)
MFLKQVYKGEIDLWRFILTVILVIGGYVLGQIPITLVSTYYLSKDDIGADVLSEFMTTMDFGAIGMDKNLTLFLLLLMFVVAMAALFIGVTRIHNRPFKSIWTGRQKVDWGRILFGFSVWLAFTIILEGIGYYYEPENYIFQFQWKPFLILLVIVLSMLPIQTAFEELFIRGYLMQAIGTVSKSRLTPLIGTSVVFGLMHSMNPEVQEYGWSTMMTYYIGIAIFLGVITLLDEGLEMAIGIHTATNLYGALFVTFEDSAIQTPALLRMAEVDPGAMASYSLGAAIFFLWIASKKYNLSIWKRVYGNVEAIYKKEDDHHYNTEKIEMITRNLTYHYPELRLLSYFLQMDRL